MSRFGLKLGVAVGMATAIASFFPIFHLLMGDCFFEQGCGPHEYLQVIGVALVSCLVGFIAAWAVARLLGILASRRQ